MIRTFRAINYGCLKNIKASLQPIHAFIGPNDSGKSTLLHGMRTVAQFAYASFWQEPDGAWKPFDPFLPIRYPAAPPYTKPHDTMLACGVDEGWYAVETGTRGLEEQISLRGTGDALGTGPSDRALREWTKPSNFLGSEHTAHLPVMKEVWGAHLLHFDPAALRAPSGLIPESTRIGFLDERGRGLPGIYFALLNRGDDSFSAIIEDVRRLFPTIKSIRVKPVTTATLVLEAELQNGVKVGAERMSEGLLYYLAFAALRYLDPVSLVLIEEPENGLHPARIAEVIKMLRTIVAETGTQIIMATHSPLVVNELEPDEVTLVTRPSLEAGTQLTPIRETHNFEKRRSVYELGELWLAYADGVEEAPLFDARRR